MEFFIKLVLLRRLTSRLSLQCANTLSDCNGIGDPDELESIAVRGFNNVEELQALELPASNEQLLETLAVFLDTAKIATDIFTVARSESHEDEDLPEQLHILIAMRHETVALVQELSVYELE
jgi:hypothetical protein